jgi:hypothetical protein
MDIKKFIADLTARYRKLMEQTSSSPGQLRTSMQRMTPAEKRDTRPGMLRDTGPAEKQDTRPAMLRGMRLVENCDTRPAMLRDMRPAGKRDTRPA